MAILARTLKNNDLSEFTNGHYFFDLVSTGDKEWLRTYTKLTFCFYFALATTLLKDT